MIQSIESLGEIQENSKGKFILLEAFQYCTHDFTYSMFTIMTISKTILAVVYVTVCFGTPVLLADLFVLSPGYKVPPDLATVPPPFSMCGLRLRCPQRQFECLK